MSSGIGWKMRLPIWFVAYVSSSVNGIASTSDVVLSMEMVSLPVGGTMTRIACGSTMRRRILASFMPSAFAASVWPGSTDDRPARTISARYADSLNARPISAAQNAVMTSCVVNVQNSGPNGMPSDSRGYSTDSRPQNTSCV